MPIRRTLAGSVLAACVIPVACASSSDKGASGDGGAPPVDAGAVVTSTPEGSADAGAPVSTPDAGRDDAGPTPGDDAGTTSDASAANEAAAPLTYSNPVVNADFPDPFVLRQGGMYYAFGTNAASKNIQAASSPDLAHWTVLPDALPSLPAWAAKNAGLTWAPSVLPLGPSTFVMYYTARDTASGFQCISHAEATSPAGPYVDSTTSAFVCQVSGPTNLCGSIDPSPFVGADGTAYLVWKSDENASACSHPPRLWSAQLTPDGLSLAGPANQLLIMDQAWQQPIIEGPTMTSIAGRYYLVYSANNYESAAYSMGYATCLSPSGPCENVSVSGPFVSSAGSALGPGGGEFFSDAEGGLWLAYHAWTAPNTTYAGGGARSLRIDRLALDAGVLSLDGPTTSPQTL